MNIVGKIHQIGEEQSVSDKFKKREFVINTGGQYPQYILLQLVNNNCSVIDSFNIGDSVVAFINLKGREYNGKYYNSIECYKLKSDE